MAQPPTLFDAPADPLPVRSTDPATARAAARRLPLRKRKAQVMAAIGWHTTGSFTADEVLDVLRVTDPRWERGAVSSRLAQLRRDGLVEPVGVAAGRRGVDVMTFRLTAEGRKWLAGAA